MLVGVKVTLRVSVRVGEGVGVGFISELSV